MASQNPNASLLGIAPELRNRIYEYALISRESINVFKVYNCKQPDLLKVCRQIRNEAISVYYTDNTFHFEACKMSGAEIVPFCRLQKKYATHRQAKLTTYMCDHRDYYDENNLRAWLKAYHAEPKLVPSLPQDAEYYRRNSKNFVVRMFGIAKSMHKKPWRKVERVLESFFNVVDMEEDMWLSDHMYDEFLDYDDQEESDTDNEIDRIPETEPEDDDEEGEREDED